MLYKRSRNILGLLIISLYLYSCGPSQLLDTPAGPTATYTSLPSVEPLIAPTFTVTVYVPSTGTPTILASETPLTSIGFDFETDTKNWHTSEGDFKLAKASVTTEVVHTGSQALQIMTQLFGGQSPEFAAKQYDQVYLHTDVTGYFDSSIPDSADRPGPYNLKGNRVSCFVYIPGGLVEQGTSPVTVQIFVKDTKFANQLGDPVDITQSNVEQWFELLLVVDNTHGADAAFDPTLVNTLGILIQVSRDSTLAYEGPIYIDTCSIEYP